MAAISTSAITSCGFETIFCNYIKYKFVFREAKISLCSTLAQLRQQLSHLDSFDEGSSIFRSSASSVSLRLTNEAFEVNHSEICSGVKAFFILALELHFHVSSVGDCPRST